MFGIWTATVVGRLVWPVLPQYVLQDDLLGLCGRLQALLNREPHREKIQAQLAVLPLEALQAVGQLRMGGCSGEERTRLAALVRAATPTDDVRLKMAGKASVVLTGKIADTCPDISLTGG